MLLHSAATWRLSYALVHERGPGSVFVKLRSWTGIIHDEAGSPIAIPDSSVLGCIYCTSVWVAVLMLAVPFVVVLVLAISTFSIAIHKKVG